MKHILALLLCLLIAPPAFGAINFVAGDQQTGSVVGSLTAFPDVFKSQTCVAFVALDQNSGAVTVTGMTDEAGSTWTLVTTVTAGLMRLEGWTAITVLADSVNPQATFSAALDGSSITVECYSGVAAIGINNTANGTSTAPSVALVTQDNNNFVVSGMAFVGNTSWSAATGNLRHTYDGSGAGQAAAAAVDNTAASPGSVTTSATLGASDTWVALAIELRSTAGATPTRQRSVMILP